MPKTDERAGQATDRAELERQIMDPNVPKNEREWWAAREIERLRTPASGGAGEMVEPSEPGGFVGDIFFGHPEYSTMGTHRWDGGKWERLRSEVEVLCDLLAAARNERDNLRTRLSATDTEAMRLLREARVVIYGWIELGRLKGNPTHNAADLLARIDAALAKARGEA